MPARYLLGEEGQGFYYLMQNFQTERLIGAVSGGRRVASTPSTARSSTAASARRSASRSSSARSGSTSFVDLYTELEAARQLTYHAVDLYNDERYVEGADRCRFETVQHDLDGQALRRRGRRRESWTSACSSTAAWATSKRPSSRRAWRDQRLLRIGGGTTEVMRYADRQAARLLSRRWLAEATVSPLRSAVSERRRRRGPVTMRWDDVCSLQGIARRAGTCVALERRATPSSPVRRFLIQRTTLLERDWLTVEVVVCRARELAIHPTFRGPVGALRSTSGFPVLQHGLALDSASVADSRAGDARAGRPG